MAREVVDDDRDIADLLISTPPSPRPTTMSWHQQWQSLVKPEYRERVIGAHRADIVLRDGTVVELQHSPISAEEIRERESHYQRMLWIFDVSEAFAAERFILRRREGYFTFKWNNARRSLEAVSAPLFFDIGGVMLRVRKLYGRRPETYDGSGIASRRPCAGWGYRLHTRQFLAVYFRDILA